MDVPFVQAYRVRKLLKQNARLIRREVLQLLGHATNRTVELPLGKPRHATALMSACAQWIEMQERLSNAREQLERDGEAQKTAIIRQASEQEPWLKRLQELNTKCHEREKQGLEPDEGLTEKMDEVREKLAQVDIKMGAARRVWSGQYRRLARERLIALAETERLWPKALRLAGRARLQATAVTDGHVAALGVPAATRARFDALREERATLEARQEAIRARSNTVAIKAIKVCLIGLAVLLLVWAAGTGVRKLVERKRTYGRIFLPKGETPKPKQEEVVWEDGKLPPPPEKSEVEKAADATLDKYEDFLVP